MLWNAKRLQQEKPQTAASTFGRVLGIVGCVFRGCVPQAVCRAEVQSSLTDRGIEVRFPVDFQAEAESRVKRVCVSAAKLDTDAPRETAGAPSLVLRCLGKQETAWDLAKRYNTTIGVILAANQLEAEGDISRDQLLLIPRKRA